MDVLASDIPSLKDVPISHFNYAVNEVQGRLKVLSSVSSFVDDISEVENNVSKALSKVGLQPFTYSKTDTFTGSGNLIENTFRSLTSIKGKNCSQFATSLNFNIVKSFPEHSKLLLKRVKLISSNVLSNSDELRKSRLLFAKNVEKYSKFVQDVDQMLRSRDGDLDSIADMSTTGDGSFMNRSFTKMFGKTADKKPDRLRDMVRDIDVQENQLFSTSKKLQVQQSELCGEVARSLLEINDLEINRQVFMRDGLSKFCIAAELLLEQQQKHSDNLTETLNHLNIVDEVLELNKVMDIIVASEEQDSHMSTAPATAEETHAESLSRTNLVLSKIDKIIESIDCLRSLTGKFNSLLLEMVESERIIPKTVQKTLEKHGYVKNAASSTNIRVSTAQGSVICADVLSSLESPTLRLAWECVVRCFEAIADVQGKGTEVYLLKICPGLESIVKKLDSIRRDLFEKQQNNSKKIDSAQSHFSKVSSKLAKVQRDLKERRGALKKCKEGVLVDSNDSDAIGDNDTRDSFSELGSDEKEDTLQSSTSTSTSTSTPSTTTPAQGRRGSAMMMAGLETFGNSLRSAKFSAVVGLETANDRMARIEAKILSLEEDETSLIEVVNAAVVSLGAVYDSSRKELSSAMKLYAEELKSQWNNLISVLRLIYNHEIEGFGNIRTAIAEVKSCHDGIDVNRDMQYFVKLVKAAADTQEYDDENDDINNATLFFNLKPVQTFEPVKSDIIEEAKRVMGISTILTNAPPSSNIESDSPPIDPVVVNSSIPSTPIDSCPSSPSIVRVFSDANEEPSSDKSMSSTVLAVDRSNVASPVASETVMEEDKESFDPINAEISSSQNSAAVETSQPDRLSLSSINDFMDTSMPYSATPSVISASLTKDEAVPVNNELSKFGLSLQDQVLESYSCALYPKNRKLLSHGRMYVTSGFLAFTGWPEVRVLLTLDNIDHIEKTNTMMYVPNALLICTTDNEEYFFGSFIDREQCYNFLNRMSQISKRLVELHGKNPMLEGRNLVLGIQFPRKDHTAAAAAAAADNSSAIMPISQANGDLNGNGDATTAASSPPTSSSPPLSSFSSPMKSSFLFTKSKTTTVPATSVLPSTRNASNSISSQDDGTSKDKREGGDSQLSSISSQNSSSSSLPSNNSVAVEAPTNSTAPIAISNDPTTGCSVPTTPCSKPKKSLEIDDCNDGIVLSTVFSKSGITQIGEYVISNASAEDIFKAYWVDGSGYADFLDSEGDLEIKHDEWKAFRNQRVVEDNSKLPFAFVRNFSYAHPRTTMLMFGPKNAPGTQKQYLYLPHSRKEDVNGMDELKNLTPRRGLVLTVTQFDGIPMADVFKVLQYWSFDGDVEKSCTHVKVGIAIFYVKSSMFKSQIFNGTKDELTEQVKKWHVFIKMRVKNYQIASLGEDHDELESSLSSSSTSVSSSSSTPSFDTSQQSGQSGLVDSTAAVRRTSIHRRNSIELTPTDQEIVDEVVFEAKPPTGEQVWNILGLVTVPVSVDYMGYALIVLSILVLLQFWRNYYLGSQVSSIKKELIAIHQALNILTESLSKSS